MSTGRAPSGLALVTVVLAVTPLLVAPKCFDYDAPPPPDTGPVDSGMDAVVDSGPADTAPEAMPDAAPDAADTTPPIDTGMIVLPTPEGMIDAACRALRCDGAAAWAYWRDDWDEYAVERTVTFRDPDASTSTFEVTDETGAPADLTFEPAVPVTLHVVSPGDGTATAAHDLTAPAFFRAIAYRDVLTNSGAYEGPTIDAVAPRFDAATEHRASIRFVPIESGTFTAWSSVGVTDGDRYAEILDGSVTPDFATGDAGKGMMLTITVSAGSDDLTVFQGEDPDRPAALDTDPRRYASDPVWDMASSVLVGVVAQEGLDPMTGESRFTFNWTTRTFTRDVGYVIELQNEPTNRFRHDFTALGMFTDSVMRAAIDADVEVRAPYFGGAVIAPGERLQLLAVPTVAREYEIYCAIGVTHAPNGAPDLTTGHAGAGMHDVITVVP